MVLPSYNRAELIGETLDRVLTQTLRPFEVIVVDDGSTDATRERLAGYGDRVRVIAIANSGDLVARNTGLRAASGDLAAFCDSDDLWEPGHLAEMVPFWDGGYGPIGAYADFREVHDGRWDERSKFAGAPPGYWDGLEPLGGGERALMREDAVRQLLVFQPFFPSCMVVDRARFLEIGGWDEGVSRMVGCDFATTLRVAEHPPIGVLRRVTVGIRKHAGNLSGDVLRMNLGDADVLDHVLATRTSLAGYRAEIDASIALRRRAAFDTAFATGDFAAVRQIAGLLGGRRPFSQHVKHGVARLPGVARRPVWRGLTWMGRRRMR